MRPSANICDSKDQKNLHTSLHVVPCRVNDSIVRFMNIAVIGTINRDTIYPFTGSKTESYGGILYNVIALAALMPEDVSLFPICNLGEDIREPVFRRMTQFQNIDTTGVRIVHHNNNHAVLRYTSPKDRTEYLENRVPPLTFQQIECALHCDFILVNFISGFDVTLDALKRLRKNFPRHIFIDIHSLTLHIDKDGRRYPKRPPDWLEWIQQADIIQLNDDEALILKGAEFRNKDSLITFVEEVIKTGPNVVLITLAEKGSLVGYRSGDELKIDRCPASQVSLTDGTGCGDVFSSGFIAEYIRSGDPVAANVFANRVAGINCTLSGLDELSTLGSLLSQQQ